MKRGRSPAFKREESQPPIISEGLWKVIKSNGQRLVRGKNGGDSSSKRSRQNPRNTPVLRGGKEFTSGAKQRKSSASSVAGSVGASSEVSTVKKFFSTRSPSPPECRNDGPSRMTSEGAANKMRAPPIPSRLGSRRFSKPPGLVQSEGMSSQVIRSVGEGENRNTKIEGDGKYFRKNLRLIGDPQKRALRRTSEEIWLLLFRRQPDDPMDPLAAYIEEEVGFARLPYRYRILAETGDRARVKILARDELRTIRNKSGNANGETFFKEFDDAMGQYRKWHVSRKVKQPNKRR